MSDDTSTMIGSDELGGDAAEVRRYRFEFRHAVALLTGVMLLLAAAGSVLSLFETGRWRDVAGLPGAFEKDWSTQPSVAEEFSEPTLGDAPDLWMRTKLYGNALLSAAKGAVNEARRMQNEKLLTKAFRELDQSDPHQVRAFLASYKNNPYAEGLGYVGAVERAIGERHFLRPENIVKCGDCWCLRERLVPANDTEKTQ